MGGESITTILPLCVRGRRRKKQLEKEVFLVARRFQESGFRHASRARAIRSEQIDGRIFPPAPLSPFSFCLSCSLSVLSSFMPCHRQLTVLDGSSVCVAGWVHWGRERRNGRGVEAARTFAFTYGIAKVLSLSRAHAPS
mmetsp:Transcript_4205/g.8558  ORF Transcript_4205/g.8558 Transcript_4205/m.8558 type:complete len:139 (+) Transcript_4205:1948-2364(+)